MQPTQLDQNQVPTTSTMTILEGTPMPTPSTGTPSFSYWWEQPSPEPALDTWVYSSPPSPPNDSRSVSASPFFSLVLVGLMICCICICAIANQKVDESRNNRTATVASVANANNNQRRIPEPQQTDQDVMVDAVKKMSVEDRKLFLSNVLKTEKYRSSFAVLSSVRNESSSFRKVFDKFSPDSCPICLEAFQSGDEMCASPNHACSHIFHRDCILGWLLKHEICPICRRNYLQLDSPEQQLDSSHDVESGYPMDSSVGHTESSGMDDLVISEPISFTDGSSDQQPAESACQSITISIPDTNQMTV